MKNALGLLVCLLASLITVNAEEHTELFGSRSFDLDQVSLTFTPDGTDSYSVTGTRISELPVDATDHIVMGMEDDSFLEINLAPKTFTFFDKSYNRCFVGSNGYITFGVGDTTWGVSLSNHFDTARISTLYDDWNDVTSVGSIKYEKLSDRLVVTFEDVEEYGTSTHKATFQTELFYADNTIRMTWLYVDNPNPFSIVGLSSGYGIPSGFYYSDLSSLVLDWDEDGIPDSWEKTHFNSIANCSATGNADGDHLDNISEYICGSDPRDGSSFFTVAIETSPSGPVLQWSAVDGRKYSVSKSDNIGTTPLTVYASNLLAPQNSYTDTAGSDSAVYQVHVELDD